MRHVDAPPLIIDAANICRDRTLSPRGLRTAWVRLEALVAAMHAAPIYYSLAHIVADGSVLVELDDTGRRTIRRLERDGRAEQHPFADERILELAFSPSSPYFGALIATLDQFDDFRRSYPEIARSGRRAVRWNP